MKYGLVFPNMAHYSDVRLLVELAQLSEEVGWDGFFLTDTVQYGSQPLPTNDPWLALAAIAISTERINLGLRVTAPPRRRPSKMVREAVTLDHLSRGRLILGVGSGDEHDQAFELFGEEMDLKQRARMLDESLEILQGLWSGQPFQFQGEHYTVKKTTFLPPAFQASGIPIWVGWRWPNKRPLKRAARFAGADPFAVDENGQYRVLTAAEIREIKETIEQSRPAGSSFDLVATAPVLSKRQDAQLHTDLQAFSEAGATWSLEFIVWPDLDALRTAIRQGPPAYTER